jgi:hypothetical protein
VIAAAPVSVREHVPDGDAGTKQQRWQQRQNDIKRGGVRRGRENANIQGNLDCLAARSSRQRTYSGGSGRHHETGAAYQLRPIRLAGTLDARRP